jgi:predicted metalloprotease with PDZ domain
VDNLAREAERNMKDLYTVTRKLRRKFQQTEKPVKNKDGNPLTTTEE